MRKFSGPSHAGDQARSDAPREVLRLAVPAFAALVVEPGFLLDDAAVVGRLGTVPLGGPGGALAGSGPSRGPGWACHRRPWPLPPPSSSPSRTAPPAWWPGAAEPGTGLASWPR